jgi:hypothetical protein
MNEKIGRGRMCGSVELVNENGNRGVYEKSEGEQIWAISFEDREMRVSRGDWKYE